MDKAYILPAGAYQAIKWIDLVALPALTTLYVALAGVWGWPYPGEIAKTSAAVCACLGALLGVSAATARATGGEQDTEPEQEPEGHGESARHMREGE